MLYFNGIVMAIADFIKKRIYTSQLEYNLLKIGKESLLQKIDEAEIAESVYNSNAIENSTLTRKQTEKILFKNQVSGNLKLREVYEAKNLARVMEYIWGHPKEEINKEQILLIHKMLIGGIEDEIAGRFRNGDEQVQVAGHIAPSPEKIEELLARIINEYYGGDGSGSQYFLDKIAKFHLDFEKTHPFIDGNGRIGRVLINWQLRRLGFPSLIIRNKEKKYYYEAFGEYNAAEKTEIMEHVLALSLLESLNRRLAYLGNKTIISLANYSKINQKSLPALINGARRQTIPAFRERGAWKIKDDFVM